MMDVPPNMRLQPTAQRAAFQIVARLPRVSRLEGLASTRPGSCVATSYALPSGHGIGRKTATAIWRAGGENHSYETSILTSTSSWKAAWYRARVPCASAGSIVEGMPVSRRQPPTGASGQIGPYNNVPRCRRIGVEL